MPDCLIRIPSLFDSVEIILKSSNVTLSKSITFSPSLYFSNAKLQIKFEITKGIGGFFAYFLNKSLFVSVAGGLVALEGGGHGFFA